MNLPVYGESRLCTGMEERKSTSGSLAGGALLGTKPGQQIELRDSSESAVMLELHGTGGTAITRIPSLLSNLSFKTVAMAS